jgi:CHAT domain-containing protein
LTVRRQPLLLAALLGLGGCQAPPPDAVIGGGGDTGSVLDQPAGKNLVGEPCHYQQTAGTPSGFARGFYLFCGEKDVSSGRILEAAGAGTDPAGAASTGPWRRDLDDRFNCGAPTTTTIGGGGSAALLQCTRRSTGLPYLALVAVSGGKTYYIDAVPSAYPAVETAVAGLSGVAVSSEKQQSTASALIRATIARNPYGTDVPAQLARLEQLAAIANDRGDYASAERALRGVAQIQEESGGTDAGSRAGTLLALAVQVSNQDRFAEADLLFHRAEALLAAEPDPFRHAQLDLSLAIDASNRGRFDEAAMLVARAESDYDLLVPPAYQRAASTAPRRVGQAAIEGLADQLFLTPTERNAIAALATAERLAAYVDWAQGNYAKAADEAPVARTLIRKAGLNAAGLVSRTYKIEGVSARDLKEFPAAESELATAIKTLEAEKTNEPLRSELLILLGETVARRGDAAAALDYYDKGIALAESLASGPDYPGLSAKAVALYLAALDAGTAADPSRADANAAKAYAALQLLKSDQTAQMAAKAFAVLSAQNSKAGDLVRAIQDADIRLKQLRGDRDAELAKPEAQIDRTALATLDKTIAEVEKTKLDAEEGAEVASPEYQQLIASGALLPELQKLLGPKEGLLLTFLDENVAHGVLVGRDFVRAYPMKLGSAELGAGIVKLRRSIVPAEDAEKLPDFDVATAHELYDAILGPVAGDLAKLDKLVIAPNGRLTSLPFEVLVTDTAKPVTDGNYAAVPFLVTRLAIGYTPSAKNLFVQRRNVKPSTAASAYIGFGDFQPPSKAQLAASFPPASCGPDLAELEELPPLPGTRKEVAYVGDSIFHAPGPDIVLGGGFTKARLMDGDLRGFRVVHLATHGLMSNELSCRHEATIVVSADPAAANADSAFLGASEILSMRLDANLVVLSACNTGTDSDSKGNSLSALARSFFYAGARGLLLTHWELSDGSGPLLTALTLKDTSAEGDTATALQHAKLSVMRDVAARYGVEYSHPFHWAAFILVGDGVVRQPAAAG